MDPVYLFGKRLSELIKQNESISVGMLLLAIKDAGKTTKQMGFQDYKFVFQTHLPKRLEKVRCDNPEKVVTELMNMLYQKQSIFTMSAR